MISKHCGKPLTRMPRPLNHKVVVWKCSVCGRYFKQKKRLPRAEK